MVIEVRNLNKRYRDKVAVDDVSFTVERGEIFGILGPNGAGKTTTVECVGGLRRPDGGTISVLGLDPCRDRNRLRRAVGIQLQESQLPDKMTVREALELYSAFNPRPPTGTRWSASWASPTSSVPGSRSCPAARSSGCRSRSPSSATRRSRSSTS